MKEIEKKQSGAREIIGKTILPKIQEMQRDFFADRKISISTSPTQNGALFVYVTIYLNEKVISTKSFEFYTCLPQAFDKTYNALVEYIKNNKANQ